MGTKRKHHPDHYQTQPSPAHERELQKAEYRKLKGEHPPPRRPAKERRHEIRAGERLGHPATLRCERCGAEAVLLAGQVVNPCKECEGETFHLAA